MAAGKNQPEFVVFNPLVDLLGRVDRLRLSGFNDTGCRGVESRTASHGINGFESPGRYQPGPRLAGTRSTDHCSMAAANASCSASFARSKSPRSRINICKDASRFGTVHLIDKNVDMAVAVSWHARSSKLKGDNASSLRFPRFEYNKQKSPGGSLRRSTGDIGRRR